MSYKDFIKNRNGKDWFHNYKRNNVNNKNKPTPIKSSKLEEPKLQNPSEIDLDTAWKDYFGKVLIESKKFIDNVALVQHKKPFNQVSKLLPFQFDFICQKHIQNLVSDVFQNINGFQYDAFQTLNTFDSSNNIQINYNNPNTQTHANGNMDSSTKQKAYKIPLGNQPQVENNSYNSSTNLKIVEIGTLPSSESLNVTKSINEAKNDDEKKLEPECQAENFFMLANIKTEPEIDIEYSSEDITRSHEDVKYSQEVTNAQVTHQIDKIMKPVVPQHEQETDEETMQSDQEVFTSYLDLLPTSKRLCRKVYVNRGRRSSKIIQKPSRPSKSALLNQVYNSVKIKIEPEF